MKNLKVLIRDINAVNQIKGRSGKFRAIIKVKAGFLTAVDCMERDVYHVFRAYKKGTIQTIQFQPDEDGFDFWLTVFAMKGKKVVIADEQLLSQITVGDINDKWYNTNLYNQHQYAFVGATHWGHKAFVQNEE
jgi:hypothetical protein